MGPIIEEKGISRLVLAVVLGGGRGTRLYPLTRERAKPAVPVGGRYRLVDIPLSNCISSGVNRIFVLTQFNSRSLHRHITDTYKFDTFSKGFVEILAAEQTESSGDWFQGTADAIRQNLWHFNNFKCEHYLILSGDHLYRMDYAEYLHRHLDMDSDVTVSALPVSRRDASEFGIMRVDDDGRIIEFVEKPQTDEELDRLRTSPEVLARMGFKVKDGREYLASMGIYYFRRELLNSMLTSRPEWIDFGKDVIPGCLENFRVYSHVFTGFWEDIGTVRSYYNTSLDLARPNAPFHFLEPDHPIYTRPRYLPGSVVRDAHMKDVISSEGCFIGHSDIEESIIGIRSVIGDNTRISRSIIMGADFYEYGENESKIPVGIGEGTVIERAIVDKNARIGKNVVIRGREDMPAVSHDTYATVDGIIVILKGAEIPDGTVIE